jgi:hypothetical protein
MSMNAPRLSIEEAMNYAHILSRCYLNRVNIAMADQLPLVRQWILLRTLCSRHHGVTIKDMVHELNVSEKTIRRDLETFQAAGFPLKEVVGEFGRKKWHIDAGKAEPGLNFAYDEAIALYLGRRFLEPLAGTVFWEAAQRAFKKIRATLGPDALKYIDQFGTMFHQTMVGAGDYTKKAELIDELNYRVKGTEMFWNDPEGAEAILQVRAAALCDDDRLTRYLSTRPGCAYVRRSSVISAA